MRLTALLVISIHLFVFAGAQKNATLSFEKWISMKSAGAPLISPDGRTIVFSVSATDWTNNTYDSELWMSRDGNEPIQLTRTGKGSSLAPAFTPDSRFVSFVADRGDKNQLYIISVQGGEALQVTKDEDGIGAYDWSPDGSKIAYTKADPESKREKTKKERFGAFAIEGEEYRLSHLWILHFNIDSVVNAGWLPCYTKNDSAKRETASPMGCYTLPTARRLTEGKFHVGNFRWSPDGKQIYFNRQINPLITSGTTSDIAVVDVSTKKISTLIANSSGDFIAGVSPDGKWIVYSTSLKDSTSNYFRNNRVFIYHLSAKQNIEIGKDIDENKFVVDWNRQGLFLSSLDKVRSKLYKVDTLTGSTSAVPVPFDSQGGISFSKHSDKIALAARNFSDVFEIYQWSFSEPVKRLTHFNAQLQGWNTPVSEVISWKSKDGTTIEGVLSKPQDYSASKKYPLLLVIHGGPTGVDIPNPIFGGVYPVLQWIEKGALVLRVNYRGSAGYGENFRSLNVRNLGVGDMWDVMSGVDHLNSRGMIDTSKMGVMGWSQGGYISAFLATNTNIFKAISVGAGISNWVTYYVNTDITPFTRQYLQATPWDDMDIYLKTSPMTNIKKATTPTLIQHGEFDKRVPLPNAYELYRGLQDQGVPSRLIVYKGFGHGINKPKERLAAIWHNWQWFNKYVFGEPEEQLPVD